MTTTATQTEATTATPATTDTWDAQFVELKTRYPKVREPILVALHIITQNPGIELDDAKAQAKLHGARITAASVAAAQRLLSRQDGADSSKAPAETKASTTRRTRRPRAEPAKTTDPEAMIREVAEVIRSQGEAESERLREAMQRAIELLQAAVA